ncbi:MAG: ester cyclase [Egibacteraceae bacterium]
MSIATNVSAVRRFFEALSADADVLLKAIDDLFAPELVTHGDTLFPQPVAHGTEGLKQGLAGFKAAFPDVTATVQQIIGEGNKVMSHLQLVGTHEAEWMGVPATHQQMTWTATQIVRFNDEGKAVERWVIDDQLAMLQQLGRVSLGQ